MPEKSIFRNSTRKRVAKKIFKNIQVFRIKFLKIAEK